LVRRISVSLPIEGVPASLGPSLGNREWERPGFLSFVPTKYPFRNMYGTPRENTKAQFALALAQGSTAAKWVCPNDVTKMTACRSAKDPMVRKAIETVDQGSFNHGMRGMTRKRIKSKVAPPFPYYKPSISSRAAQVS
jgi:hypothetical protein